jgi:hypothetical protein
MATDRWKDKVDIQYYILRQTQREARKDRPEWDKLYTAVKGEVNATLLLRNVAQPQQHGDRTIIIACLASSAPPPLASPKPNEREAKHACDLAPRGHRRVGAT